MSRCTACTKKYGLFLREVGCGKCGFSFCSKCTKSVIDKMNVCNTCFNKTSQKSTIIELPKGLSTSARCPVVPIINDADIQLQNRLERLRQIEGSDRIETQRDVQERLAALQDRPFVEDKPNRDIFKIDGRSDQQKIDGLVAQYVSETAIDESTDPVKDIEMRLNQLRGEASLGSASAKPLRAGRDSPDDDKIYVKKILAEAILDAELNLNDDEKELMEGIPKPPAAAHQQDTEELPWCTICNEDARIRCIDCDGELYCRPCFKEIHHDDEEYRAHRTKAFEKSTTNDYN